MKASFLRNLALALALWICASTLAAEQSETALFGPDAGSRWELAVGSGLGMLDGEVGWGLGLGISRGGGLSLPFWMGLDLSVYRFDYTNAPDPLKPFAFVPESASATLIQVLPTFLWDLPVAGWPSVVPYLGLAVGPAFYLASADRRVGASLARGHESLVGLAAYLRPGIRAELAPSLRLVLETKLGLFRGRTVFLPQFALAWNL